MMLLVAPQHFGTVVGISITGSTCESLISSPKISYGKNCERSRIQVGGSVRVMIQRCPWELYPEKKNWRTLADMAFDAGHLSPQATPKLTSTTMYMVVFQILGLWIFMLTISMHQPCHVFICGWWISHGHGFGRLPIPEVWACQHLGK